MTTPYSSSKPDISSSAVNPTLALSLFGIDFIYENIHYFFTAAQSSSTVWTLYLHRWWENKKGGRTWCIKKCVSRCCRWDPRDVNDVSWAVGKLSFVALFFRLLTEFYTLLVGIASDNHTTLRLRLRLRLRRLWLQLQPLPLRLRAQMAAVTWAQCPRHRWYGRNGMHPFSSSKEANQSLPPDVSLLWALP